MRLLVASALATVMVAGAAQAADLPTKGPVYKAPVGAPFSWTGFYIGAQVGGGWGRKEWSDSFDPVLTNNNHTTGPDATYDVDGPLAGGLIGFNWQYGWTVFGVEADANWADIKGTGTNDPGNITGPTSGGCLDQGPCTTKIDALGTITGRLGVAADRALFYAKGGAAWVREKHTVGFHDPQFPNDPFSNYSGTTSQTRWGWTVGGGFEYAFANNWSAKIEYNYMDFGREQVTFSFTPTQSFGTGGNLEQTMHVVKGGLNYRFSY
jgi:outer membrane immunogenic protein